jgi:LysM repeat protein
MAELSFDHKYVTVQKGDTLSEIARDYAKYSNNATYQQLAAINDIPNADYIVVGQEIYLVKAPTSSSTKKQSDNRVVKKQFGYQADVDNSLFISWTCSLTNIDHYLVRWQYYTRDKEWYPYEESTTTSKISTYSIPNNATVVRVKVKPVAKTKKVNGKDTEIWNGEWTDWFDQTGTYKPETPPVPTVSLNGLNLTASVDNLKDSPSEVEFNLVANDNENGASSKAERAPVEFGSAAFTFNSIKAGATYKVRARAKRDNVWGNWSDYSEKIETIPGTPEISKCGPKTSATTPTVHLEWASIANAETYEIEYTTKKSNFEGSDQVTSKTGIATTSYDISSGIEKGNTYYFRLRAVNAKGSSGWSEVSSTVVGTGPAAPTTWSSTNTVISGEPLILYWVHNSEDGSSQSSAHLEISAGGVKVVDEIVKNDRPEKDKDKTSSYAVKMVNSEGTPLYPEGTKLEWRVRTAGILNETYGDWSIVRAVDVYAPPTLDLEVRNSSGNTFEKLDSLPLKVHAVAGPNTQAPIGYYLTITAEEPYETVDSIGNLKIVKTGDQVYGKYFDVSTPLDAELSASDLSLENGVSYKLTCTVSMNSGLTAEESFLFAVAWAYTEYSVDAEITIDTETYSAYVRPYCVIRNSVYYKVTRLGSLYTKTSDVINGAYGSPVNKFTKTGEEVMYGTTDEGEITYYCSAIDETPVTDVLLSVYRREHDGTFTEIFKDLDGTTGSYITDPHPSLDYARYRVVAVSKSTSSVVYRDVPGVYVGEKAIIIQWDEAWSTFDTFGPDNDVVQPPWSGSLLRLPYNIDTSSSTEPDVAHINYIGRKRPVTYYGTQIGETATWNVEIDKNDKETLYALRRLAAWLGNAYVREPSGIGYWASVRVSYNTKHKEVTIPVTIDVTRVEGGV